LLDTVEISSITFNMARNCCPSVDSNSSAAVMGSSAATTAEPAVVPRSAVGVSVIHIGAQRQ